MPLRTLRAACCAVLLLAVGCAEASGGSGKAPPDIAGVVVERAPGRNHQSGEVHYTGKLPPSGGPHNPVPLTCGAYREQPPDEFAVHSLEHGAVWVAYDPSLAAADVDALEQLAALDHVIVTPYAGMDATITLVAWEHRLELDSVSDPRLRQFVDGYTNARTAPEAGGACAGVGQPAS